MSQNPTTARIRNWEACYSRRWFYCTCLAKNNKTRELKYSYNYLLLNK